jgi:AbrB family looped-hinge helix DNA binding protein
MEDFKTMSGAIKSRGQLTIPKKIRDAGGFEEGQEVSIIPLGDSIIITPRKIDLEEARRAMRKILRSSGLTGDEILAELKEDRRLLYKETYGNL